MVSSFLAVPLGPLYYRSVEQDKIHVLGERKGDWGKPMMLSDKARGEIKWWVENVQGQVAPIRRSDPRAVNFLASLAGSSASYSTVAER